MVSLNIPLRSEFCQNCEAPIEDGDIFYVFEDDYPHFCSNCAMNYDSDYAPKSYILHNHSGRYILRSNNLSSLPYGVFYTKKLYGEEVVMAEIESCKVDAILQYNSEPDITVYETQENGIVILIPRNMFIGIDEYSAKADKYKKIINKLNFFSYQLILNVHRQLIGFASFDPSIVRSHFELIEDDMFFLNEEEL